MAVATNRRLWSSPPVGTPAPAPVTSWADRPVNAPINAAADVVLPMPKSPPMRQSTPAAICSEAIRMPTASAASAWSGVMAASEAMLAVPSATLSVLTPGSGSRGVFTPTSTTTTSAPTASANTEMAAPPLLTVATMAAVISDGHALAPSATTPWSPANTTTTGLRGAGGGQTPAIPARWTATSCSRPSAPGGMARVAHRARASSMASASSG